MKKFTPRTLEEAVTSLKVQGFDIDIDSIHPYLNGHKVDITLNGRRREFALRKSWFGLGVNWKLYDWHGSLFSKPLTPEQFHRLFKPSARQPLLSV